MRRLRVGIIGLGIGLKHIDGYERAHCEIAGLCDLSAAKLKQAALRYPGAVANRKAERILRHPGIDVVSIATYDDVHSSHVLSALKNGKHVFVEKPLCQNLAQLKQIIHAWKKRKIRLKLTSNLILRAAPLYRWLKREIDKGSFGKIYAFDGDYLYGRIEKITGGWRRDVKNYSVMQGGGIHLIDLLLWLTGERPNKVSSAGNRISTKGTAFRYNDYVASTFEFTSGMVARITANFSCVHKHQHVLRIFGTKQTFIYDDQGPRIYKSRNPSRPAKRIGLSALALSKGDLIPEFIENISRGKNMEQETQAAFDSVSVSASADQALKSRSKLEIRYL